MTMIRTRIASTLTTGLAVFIAAAAFGAQGCSAASDEATNDQISAATRAAHRGVMWKRGSGIQVASAPAGAHLTYYGGRVNAATNVVMVLWGSGSYESHVTSTATPSMLSFYQQLLGNGKYTSWLDSEYNTVNPSGTKTNQHIGTGSSVAPVTITPSVTGSVSDAQIQSEITRQVGAGHLPAPTHDAAGNATTYYAVFFPHGTTINQGGSSSCVSGGFCAYHGTVAAAGSLGEYYYGVHPDMQSGSGCDTGCGSAGSAFGNYTSVASHELTEMITDAEVGLATANAPPLAWYDSTNGEIGDICNAQQGSYVGCDGQTYTVQLEFSNAQNNCINWGAPSCGGATPDFTIADSPATASIAQGGSTTSAVSTTAVGGAGTVALGASVSPSGAGVTASLSPTSVAAGSSSTLTIAASTTAAAGTYTVTINGTEGTKAHSSTVTVTVTSSGGGGGSLTNGGFEAGNLSGWTASGTSSVVSSGAHSGTYAAQLGGSSPTNGDSSIAQTFTVPSGDTQLSFYYKVTCPDTVTYDWATATLKDNTSNTTTTILAKTCVAAGAWTQVTAAVTAGHSYTLTLTSHDDNYAGDPTFTLFDDVTLAAGAPPPPSGITNGGFETGSLSGWTNTGASETVVSAGAHSGTYAARLGTTTATNGDSTISQTFTAPSGASKISFWYGVTCPDTLTYDWATATLKDNTSNTTTTLLAKTCVASSGWVSVTGAITAGHSYTVTLTSHDDNYGADPTYTLYDDVATQ